jgi:tetratricopeptide (TPR) repeat protein
MNKENILFSIIGVLLGFIVGFMFANTVNSREPQHLHAAEQPSGMGGQSAMPPGAANNTGGDPHGMSMEQIRASIDKAKNEPNNFEAQMKAAELYSQIGRYEQAITFLEQANKIKPDDYETVVRLANMNHAASKFEEAERWYTVALAKNPKDVDVRTDLGLTFYARNPPNIDRAIKEYNRALEIEPKHEATLNNLVLAHLKKGDATNAQATLAKLEEVNPKNEALPKMREELEKLRSGSKTQAAITDQPKDTQ